MTPTNLKKPTEKLIQVYNKKGVLVKVVSVCQVTNNESVIYKKKSKIHKVLSSLKKKFFGKNK